MRKYKQPIKTKQYMLWYLLQYNKWIINKINDIIIIFPQIENILKIEVEFLHLTYINNNKESYLKKTKKETIKNDLIKSGKKLKLISKIFDNVFNNYNNNYTFIEVQYKNLKNNCIETICYSTKLKKIDLNIKEYKIINIKGGIL